MVRGAGQPHTRGNQLLQVPLGVGLRHLVRGTPGGRVDHVVHSAQHRADSPYGAELVKALVLARSRRVKRDREIAAQWDSIERDLRVPEVWAFVTGKSAPEATHITLLLDTLAGRPSAHPRPLFQTFETLRPQIEESSEDLWNRVIDLHSLVMGWYDNRDLFHKIGYLIARGRRFDELVGLSNDCTKREFGARLDARIRDGLTFLRPMSLSFAMETGGPRLSCC